MKTCKHCGRNISKGSGGLWIHETYLYRCLQKDSGQPYGLEAEPSD